MDSLDRFIAFREDLIEKLDQKAISKEDFIMENFKYFKKNKLKPIKDITSVEEGVFNYQYYNIMAKYNFLKIFEIEFRDPIKASELQEKAFEYYRLKDNVIKKILKIVNYENVVAYFVKMDSEFLNGELFEIVLKDYEKIIFHTKDKLILNRLKKNDVFKAGIRDSVITNYINKKY